MKRIGVVGLSLAAMFAFSVVAASTAAAAPPEYGRCVAKAGGKFTGASCTNEAAKKGKFEWLFGPGPKNTFTSTSGIATLQTVNGPKVVCQSDSDTGEYSGAKGIANLVITFTGCESSGVKCQSAGANEGEIVTTSLRSDLVSASLGTKLERAGTRDRTAPAEGEFLALFFCGPSEVRLAGAVLVYVPVNKMETQSVQKFLASKGKQKPEFYEVEGEKERAILEESFANGPFEQTGLTTTETITNEEPLEIRTMAFPAYSKWWIEGKLLEGKEPIAEETTVTEPFKVNLEGAAVGPFVIVCKGVKVKNGYIEGPGARKEAAVVFEQCEAEGKSECSVPDAETKPLNSQLEGAPGAIKLKVEPEISGEIVGFHLTHVAGEPPCKEEGLYRASGFMIGNYGDVETEATEHALEFTATSGSDVYVKTKNGAYFDVGFTGTDTVHLTSGRLWSALF